MRRAAAGFLLMICTGWLACGQPTETRQGFEAADVHISPKSTSLFSRSSTSGGRYQVKNATMVDLIRAAYNFDADKILGGPNWLELDRFDVIAKSPPDITPDGRRQMLQKLLAERFKLVVHEDTKPMPAWSLTAGKKLQMKPAEAAGENPKPEDIGCKPQSQAPVAGQPMGRVMMSNSSGAVTTFDIGPGGTVRYACRNVTMAAFVDALRSMFGTNLNQRPVLNETGLEGRWNFELTYTAGMLFMGGDTGGRISILEAVDKQLGLKLEEKQVPTPVMVVDSVDRKPAGNPPGTAEALPPIPAPTEFEVASVKEAQIEGGRGPIMRRFGMQAGGRFEATGSPLSFLINRAFNTNNRDQIVGLPSWADSTMYDIIAKASVETSGNPMMDSDALAPMLLNLLKDRFKLAYHTEERPAGTYTLSAGGKPKMKKADPASRIFCKTPQPPPGSPPMTRVLTCQNVTMGILAERLQGMTQELTWPVADATELEGGWDFTLTFSMGMPMMFRGPGGDAGPGGAAVPTAADPTAGLTIFEAVEKQLGLKLAMQKRPMQVIVIDHLEQKPTEN
ncbi:MAG TPA: TIGR03435 family protein [Verrucomicrobiae bacterium]|nr:TIGR03435 family protein [Verrucomicrobiae bacterium]